MTSSSKLICNFIVWHALWIFWNMGEITIKGAKALVTYNKNLCLHYFENPLFILFNEIIIHLLELVCLLMKMESHEFESSSIWCVFFKHTKHLLPLYVFQPPKNWTCFLLLKLSPNVFKKTMGPLNLKHFTMVLKKKLDKKHLLTLICFSTP